MTNKEKYKEELDKLLGYTIAVVDGKPCKCSDSACAVCAFKQSDCYCIDSLHEWLNSEYIEDDWFAQGEIIEVSDDNYDWKIRAFDRMCDEEEDIRYPIRDTSGCGWKYARKYGSAVYDGGFEATLEGMKHE